MSTVGACNAQTTCQPTVALESVGITPEILCIAGVSTTEVSLLISQLDQSTELSTYLSTKAAYSASIEQLTATMKAEAVSDDPQSAQVATEQAQEAVTTAKVANEQAEAQLWDEISSLLQSGKFDLIETAVANRTQRLPLEYCTLELTDSDASALLLASKLAQTDEPPAWVISVVSTYNSNQSVLTASVRLDSNLSSIRTAFSCN